jgi:hypothetical protein
LYLALVLTAPTWAASTFEMLAAEQSGQQSLPAGVFLSSLFTLCLLATHY